jgi:hypothetical protein
MILAKSNIGAYRVIHVVKSELETYRICRAAGKAMMTLQPWDVHAFLVNSQWLFLLSSI